MKRASCPECGEPARARGLCMTHYFLAKRRGDFGKPCEWPGCDQFEHAAGLCNPHYNQRRRDAGFHICRHPEGCTRTSVKDFLCKKHFLLVGVNVGKCRIESCSNPIVSQSGRQLCSRCNHRKKKYPDLRDCDLDALAAGAMCQICKEEPATDVDHCHDTGWIRGFLCGNCNRGLGQFKDRDDVMHRAIEYLWRNSPLHQEWRCGGSVD